jgi:hypothetical protein
MENSNKLVAKEYYDSIKKRNLNKLVNSGTRDPDAKVLLKPKRESLRKSLSTMLKRMAVRLPPNAENKGNAPETPEAALKKLKDDARGSVIIPDDNETV